MLGPLKKFSMAGKHVLVTGASSGFGAHFSRVLAGAGAASVVMAARRVDKLEQLQRDLGESHPECRTLAVRMDVSDAASIRDAFARMEADLPADVSLNVLINNAGVGDPAPFLHMTEESFDYVVGTNLRGAVFVAQQAAAHMVRRGVTNGSIVNVASIMALRPGTRHVNYCASKAGLQHASKCMAVELFKKGIRVNCINPGYFVTEINREYLTSDAGMAYLKTIPPGRSGDLEELDGPLLLLASDAGSFLNGTEIVVDGGHSNAHL